MTGGPKVWMTMHDAMWGTVRSERVGGTDAVHDTEPSFTCRCADGNRVDSKQ